MSDVSGPEVSCPKSALDSPDNDGNGSNSVSDASGDAKGTIAGDVSLVVSIDNGNRSNSVSDVSGDAEGTRAGDVSLVVSS